MKVWTFVHNPLEYWLDDYKRIFDAWHDGGMRGIVIGRMFFQQDDGTQIPTYRADPECYKALGVPPLQTLRQIQQRKSAFMQCWKMPPPATGTS